MNGGGIGGLDHFGPQPGGLARRAGFQHEIGPGHEVAQKLAMGAALGVEHQAALAGPVRGPGHRAAVGREGADAAGVDALGRLHLNHVGAELGEDAPGQRAAVIGQVEHAIGREEPGPGAVGVGHREGSCADKGGAPWRTGRPARRRFVPRRDGGGALRRAWGRASGWRCRGTQASTTLAAPRAPDLRAMRVAGGGVRSRLAPRRPRRRRTPCPKHGRRRRRGRKGAPPKGRPPVRDQRSTLS